MIMELNKNMFIYKYNQLHLCNPFELQIVDMIISST